MHFKKTSPESIATIDNALAGLPCDRKKMFGAIAYFINGNMFAGAHQDELFLRLSATDRQAIMQEYDEVSAFEPMPGRPMTEYVTLPESVYSQPGMLSEWLDRCRRYAALIAPKTGKKQNKKPGK